MADQLPELVVQAQEALVHGDYYEADELFASALQRYPEDAATLLEVGIFWLGSNRAGDAIPVLQKSIELKPGVARAHNVLGNAYKHVFALAEAEVEYKKAIELDERYEVAYSNLASVLEMQGKIKEARFYVNKANELFPQGIFITVIEAIVLRREGRFEEAIDILRSKPFPQDPMTRLQAKCALGLIYDEMGETAIAFENIDDFNRVAREDFQITSERKAPFLNRLQKCHDLFSSDRVEKIISDAEPCPMGAPVCLTGFARSGTTLLQHILDSHPAIYASEEVQAFSAVSEQVTPYPDALAHLDADALDRLRNLYFDTHKKAPGWQDKDILVDKYPMLASDAGLVYRLFPDAKFLFIRRHPMDCILSCYMQFFIPNEAMVHFYSLDDAVEMYTKYMDLWDVYRNRLPLNVYDLKYEDLISDFEGTIKGVLNFIGADWDDAVQNYNQAARKKQIKTPSYAQVRKKIYTRSDQRWKKYERYLEPYLDRLAPYIERMGY